MYQSWSHPVLDRSFKLTGGRRQNHRENPSRAASGRFVGIDVGAETIKVVELVRQGDALVCGARGRRLIEHGKEPGARLLESAARLGLG